jgi:hypothetical protein
MKKKKNRFIVVMVHLNLVNAMVIQFYSLLLEQAAYKEIELAEIRSVEASLSRKCTQDVTLKYVCETELIYIFMNVQHTHTLSLSHTHKQIYIFFFFLSFPNLQMYTYVCK